MKRLLLTTSLIATMTAFGSALADNLSDSAKHDLTQVKPAPVQAILVHGAPIGDGAGPQVIHINTPEMTRSHGVIIDSINPRNSADDAAFNVLAGTVGDNNQGFISLTKNILASNEFFAYMLTLRNQTPQIFDVLTRVMIIKELAQIHQDLVHRGACHG
jgi:hypothetical protein